MCQWCSLSVLLIVLGAEDPELRGTAFVGLTDDLGPGINDEHNEWGLNLCQGDRTLIFSSDRPGGSGSWDLYLATRPEPHGPFGEPINLGSPVNTGQPEYNGALSADGKTLFYSHHISPGYWNLWVATREDETQPFQNATELSTVNGSWACAAPWLSLDEQRLYFASGRPGGKGMADIWVSLRDDVMDPLSFGEPIHIDALVPGSLLSTSYSEAPGLTGDELSVFFTDGWEEPFRPGGAGQSDIWVSLRSSPDESFGAPINVNELAPADAPVNTSAPEIVVAVSSTWPRAGAELYFIGFRRGPRDIWRATWEAAPEPRFSRDPSEGPPPLTVSFDAGSSSTPAGTEPLRFAWDFGDGSTGEGSTVTHTYREPGRTEVTLTASNSADSSYSAMETVTVYCPPGNVAPWTSADVGMPLLPGSATMDGNGILICAGGATLSGSSDEFHFVHREVSGDFTAVVRVAEVANGEVGASLGLMVRRTLDPSSQHAAGLLESITAGHRHRLRYRAEDGLRSRSAAGPSAEMPAWLRLDRRGELIVALQSPDGEAWEEVGRETLPGLPDSVLCGVAAYGRDLDDTTRAFDPLRARLEDLEVHASGTTFVRGNADADGAMDISDGIFILNFLFLGGAEPPCMDAADIDDSGALNVSDAVRVFNFLFLSGNAPAAPFPDCGADPSADELTCDSFIPCE